MNKCVFVIGPESSGSIFIAKIAAEVLGISQFGKWDGIGWCPNEEQHLICHRSLPYGADNRFPDLDNWIQEYSSDYELIFILTTRDITLSEISRIERFRKSVEHVQKESNIAKDMMKKIIREKHRFFIWSYESFMFLGEDYLKLLYELLEVNSSFFPELRDANCQRIMKGRMKLKPKAKILSWIESAFKGKRKGKTG